MSEQQELTKLAELKDQARPLLIEAFNGIEDREQLERLMRAVSLAKRNCLGDITIKHDGDKPFSRSRALEMPMFPGPEGDKGVKFDLTSAFY